MDTFANCYEGDFTCLECFWRATIRIGTSIRQEDLHLCTKHAEELRDEIDRCLQELKG